MKHSMAYVEDYTCIISPCKDKGGLFIGNLEAAENINTLQKNKIKAILTAARGVKLNHKRQQIPYYLHIHADDNEQFQLSKYFNQASNFIRDALQKTNVMVHCLAGVSRSVSLVIAYFIKHNEKSFDQAYSFIKEKRRVAHPNYGFVKQLKRYQLQNQKKSQIKNQQMTPLTELNLININPQKCLVNNNNGSVVKNNKQKLQRVPGRIKRFNSVVQTQLVVKEKAKQFESRYQTNETFQKYFKKYQDENTFRETSNISKIFPYKYVPLQIKQSFIRSHFP